jgi:hypothetical protein
MPLNTPENGGEQKHSCFFRKSNPGHPTISLPGSSSHSSQNNVFAAASMRVFRMVPSAFRMISHLAAVNQTPFGTSGEQIL